MTKHHHHEHHETQGEDHDAHARHGDTRDDQHEGHHDHHAHMIVEYRRRFFVSLVLSIPIILLSPMIQGWLGVRQAWAFAGDGYLSALLSTLVFAYGGAPFLKGFVEEIKGRDPGMMTLIAVAISTAYLYSMAVVFGLSGDVFFWELATLIDVMLVGHWIEMASVMGASRALEELAKLMPDEAHRIEDDGTIRDVPTAELVAGDRLRIKPGEKIPADAVIVGGSSSLDESMLTGESKPVRRGVGEQVIGGSVNGEGSLDVEVERTGENSFLSQVIDLVRQAQASKSKTQDLANRAARVLTVVALGGGASTFLVWWAFTDQPLSFAIERAVTVMVISCPHALGLAVPLVTAVSTALAARNGLLIRDRPAFEAARNLGAILFDKTGTLTKGEFGVTDTILLGDDPALTSERILNLAASLESYSEHPIARGIVQASQADLEVEGFESITGKGAQALVDGLDVRVVSPGYLREHDLSVSSSKIDAALERGSTVVYVLVEGELVAAIALADVIRPESKEAIARFKAMGIQCMMITGDNADVAKSVSDEIGLDAFFAEVLPEQKAAKVAEVQASGLTVAMTGDGVNDAPALAAADVGIAVGAGTDVAVETADIVLVSNDPRDVASLIELSRSTYKKMIQNLIWATGYNAVAIPMAAGVFYSYGLVMSPAVGAGLMSLSTVIVAINARLLRME